MKPRNFPARVMRRRVNAHARECSLPAGWQTAGADAAIKQARAVRTKKDRSSRAKVRA